MGASAYYHMFNTIGAREMKFLRKYDYSGICIMIMGSSTAPFYYGFMCDDSFFYGKLYLIQVYACCLFALYVTLFQSSEKSRLWINAISYIIAGYSTAPGMLHLAYKSEADQVHNFAVWPWLTGGILYAIGAIIYALKMPEKLFVGWFDYVGASHQIFHFFIIAAALLHMWASFRVFHERRVYGCPEHGVFDTP